MFSTDLGECDPTAKTLTSISYATTVAYDCVRGKHLCKGLHDPMDTTHLEAEEGWGVAHLQRTPSFGKVFWAIDIAKVHRDNEPERQGSNLVIC